MLPKISIITSCYNGESHLKYFLDSLLTQDYSNVEFFFVDDGSTDKTKEIFYQYISKLEEKGWKVKYIYKENGGIASAINAALPLITGKYFIYPDSDDILYANHISEKVKYMEKNPDIGISYCIVDVVKDSDLNKVLKQDLSGKKYKTAFQEVFNERKIFWPPIKAIISTESFFNVLPDKKIPECKGGQNCQVQLPILYKYQAGFIPISLGKYVLRPNSNSRIESRNFIIRRFKNIVIWTKTILILHTANNIEKIWLIFKVLIRNIVMIVQHYISKIFSIKNKKQNNEKRTIINILGLKIKFKNKITK